jgi:DNA-binding transcriptional LysR family regulator
MRTVLNHPFVYPIYWTSEGIRHGDDYFPISIKKRIRGFETATATSAAHIVAQTDHIGFLPDLISAPLISQGLLRVIEAPTIKPVSQKVFLTVKSDAIKQQRLEWMRRQCQALLLNTTVT